MVDVSEGAVGSGGVWEAVEEEFMVAKNRCAQVEGMNGVLEERARR